MPKQALLLLLLAATGCAAPRFAPPADPGPAVLSALAHLLADSSALAHIDARPEAFDVVERRGPRPELHAFVDTVATSERCGWRGLDRDSISARAIRQSLAASAPDDRSPPPRPAPAGLVAFVSLEVDGMRTVTVFATALEREGRGRRYGDYSRFNRSAEYLVCGGPDTFEVFGPQLWHID